MLLEWRRELATKRFWILAGAAAVTLASLALALLLGAAVFDFKRFSDHEGMLRRVMRKQPTAEQLTQGLRDVDAPLVGVLTTRDEVGRVVAARGGRKAAEIHEKAARYAETRVYESADMLYFVYFDAAGVMRDFTCVSR